MASKIKTSLDSRSLCIVLATVFLILLIVVVGILVNFFMEETLSRIILIILICVLSIVGLSVLTYLEFRKRAIRQEAKEMIAKNGYYYNNIKPNAPRDSSWEYTGNNINTNRVV